MAINYAWDVSTVDTYPTKDSNSDVVYNVHWRFFAKDDSEVPYIANEYGVYSVEYDKSNFITYSKLKKEDVVGWLEAGLDIDQMKKNLDNEIESKKNPVENHLNPNWD